MITLTSEYLFSVLWLGCDTQEAIAPIGSGVAIRHQDKEYLATAHHVAEPCAFQPRIRRGGKWLETKWQEVASDSTLDIAVLKTSMELAESSPKYGSAHIVYAGLGRAIGFPHFSDNIDTPEEFIQEFEGHPVPITVVVSSSIALASDSSYAGGYINSGFSGGAIVLPTKSDNQESENQVGWTIAGIITERGEVWKHSAIDKDGKAVLVGEPSGMVRFVNIRAILKLIEEATGRRS